MAPALTEPLSPTNKLSASTSSASPRPVSVLSSNTSSNSNNNNRNISRTAASLSPKTVSTSSSHISYRRSPRHSSVAFQSAFEKSVAEKLNSKPKSVEKTNNIRKTASSSRISSQKLLDTNGSEVSSSEISPPSKSATFSNSKANKSVDSTNKSQMGPMCDTSDINDQTLTENLTNLEKVNRRSERTKPNNKQETDSSNTTIIVPLESDFEEAINQSLQESGSPKQDIGVRIEDIKRLMDFQQLDSGIKKEELQIEKNEHEEKSEDISHEVVSTGTTDTTATASETEMIFEDHYQDNIIELEDRGEKTPKRSQQKIQPQSLTPLSGIITASTPHSQGSSSHKGDFIKDSSEMDQVLGDMDLLSVFKCFDSTTGGNEEFSDLAAVFNDVDDINYDEATAPITSDQTVEIRNEIEKRQQKMQRKCDFLLKRLKRIQTRYMAKHVSEEISGLFEWTNRLVRIKKNEEIPHLSYDEDKHRQVSITSMRSLLHRIDVASNWQHDQHDANNKSNKKLFGGRTDAKIPNVINSFDEKTTEEIGHLSGLMQAEFKQIQADFDSDATASSSGGESADEMVTYNNQSQQSLVISKRAAWHWARDRSSIAARWSWLCSQISDLEYRIRQYNDLYTQIKKNKGQVLLEKHQILSPSTSKSEPNNVNGLRNNTINDSSVLKLDESPPNGAYECMQFSSCRTRSFQRTGFRKRKLLQTANIHTISKKAAKSSTVKCGCQWPLHPCALCTGRSDPMAPRDLPDTMNLAERVSLLDPSFHSVLSFLDDISSSIHMEGLLQNSECQFRISRNIAKLPIKNTIKDLPSDESAAKRKKYMTKKVKQEMLAAGMAIETEKIKKSKKNLDRHLTKKPRKISGSTTAVSPSATKSSPASTSKSLSLNVSSTSNNANTTFFNNNSVNGFQNAFAESLGTLNCDNLDGASSVSSSQLPRSKNSSPTPYSGGNYKYERMFDRRNRNSYDIDNIVIPYSVAAATRVEVLQYKEIPTPKWRVIGDNEDEICESDSNNWNKQIISKIIFPVSNKTIENKNFCGTDSSIENNNFIKDENCSEFEEQNFNGENEEAEEEDISDPSIYIRHERALLEERRKFSTYLKFPWSTRSRANRRIDSRAESSGANTPDPASPAPNTPSVSCDQESIPSPAAPATPQNSAEPIEGIDSSSTNQNFLPSINVMINSLNAKKERRRTVSTKKEQPKEELRRSTTPDPKEIVMPYEALKFPLSEEFYDEMLALMPMDDDKPIIADDITDKTNLSTIHFDNSENSFNTNSLNLKRTSRFHSSIKVSNRKNSIDSSNNDNSIFSIPTSLPSFKNKSELTSFSPNQILEDSDTDSADFGGEDPNDPEWKDEPE